MELAVARVLVRLSSPTRTVMEEEEKEATTSSCKAPTKLYRTAVSGRVVGGGDEEEEQC